MRFMDQIVGEDEGTMQILPLRRREREIIHFRNCTGDSYINRTVARFMEGAHQATWKCDGTLISPPPVIDMLEK